MKITPPRVPTFRPDTILAFVVAFGVIASLLLTRFAVARGVSCEAGDLTACVELGQAYQTVDITRTVDLWQRACDGGEMMGCANLGVMYEHGSGVKQDFTRAVGLYEEACEGGNLLGCRDLGVMYETGRGVTRDTAQAISLYGQACDGGEMQGCTNLALLDEVGRLEQLPMDDRILLMGVETSGTLREGDPGESGSYEQAWALTLGTGQDVTVDLTSSDFDAYLFVTGPGLDPVLRDDDGGDGCNARIAFTAPEAAEYRVIVTTFGSRETGDYMLRAGDAPAARTPSSSPCS